VLSFVAIGEPHVHLVFEFGHYFHPLPLAQEQVLQHDFGVQRLRAFLDLVPDFLRDLWSRVHHRSADLFFNLKVHELNFSRAILRLRETTDHKSIAWFLT
jgi:hypothetical protein